MLDSLITGLFRILSSVAAAVVGPLVRQRIERKSGAEEDSPVAFIRERNGREVFATLQAIPPLGRSSLAVDLYHGRWVRWTGTIQNISGSSDSFIIALVDDAELPCWSFVDFPKSARAVLEQLREGDRIRYEAQIRKVWIEGGDIKLQDGRVLEVEEADSKGEHPMPP